MWPEIIGRNKQSCQKKQSDYDNNDCFWRVFGRGYEKTKDNDWIGEIEAKKLATFMILFRP